MGSETIWSCDICKKVVPFERLAYVINVERLHSATGMTGNSKSSVFVCRNCKSDVEKLLGLT